MSKNQIMFIGLAVLITLELAGIYWCFIKNKPSDPNQEIYTCVKCEELDGLHPEILSSSQMSYFSSSESYEKMTMHDLLSVHKTAGTASTDEYFEDLLEVLSDPKRHGSPMIHDYRYNIWLRTSVHSGKWSPFETRERRTLTYDEILKVLGIIDFSQWMYDEAKEMHKVLASPHRTLEQAKAMDRYMLKMSDWIMLQSNNKETNERNN